MRDLAKWDRYIVSAELQRRYHLEPGVKLSNFAIDIREIRPVPTIRCAEEEGAKKTPEIAWLQAALIGDLDHRSRTI